MKPINILILTLGLPLLAVGQPAGPSTNLPSATPAPTNLPATSAMPAGASAAQSNSASAAAPAAPANAVEPAVRVEHGANGLRMNFRNAPLNLVLDHLVKAAGFVVNGTTPVRGTITVMSEGPVTKDEAVALLNSELKKNGYAVVRNGRILTIVDQASVKTANLEITTPYNPDEIQDSDEVITALIHIRYANASQLVSNLELLLPTNATLSANESANTIILVATKTDVKRMLKIINALDSSIASVSSIKVVPLKYADAKDTANLITQLFSPQSTSQSPGAGGFSSRRMFYMLARRGGFGGPGSSGGTSGTGSAAARVVAVADDRSNSVVISAPEDLLATICETVDRIDQPVTDETEVRVFRLTYADPSELADQLSQLFPDPTDSASGSQNSRMPFFFRSRFGSSHRDGNTSSTDTSERMKKLGRVLAVPDPRTQSLLVSASKTMMPDIAEMIKTLDADPGKREVVRVFDLQNADPQDVNTVLQDLFNRNVRMQNANNNRSLLGNNNPLTQRETQQRLNNNANIGFGLGNSRGRAGGF